MFQGGFHAMRTRAVGPAFQLILLDAQRSAHLQDLAAIVTLGQANILVRIVRPALQHIPQITHGCIILWQ